MGMKRRVKVQKQQEEVKFRRLTPSVNLVSFEDIQVPILLVHSFLFFPLCITDIVVTQPPWSPLIGSMGTVVIAEATFFTIVADSRP